MKPGDRYKSWAGGVIIEIINPDDYKPTVICIESNTTESFWDKKGMIHTFVSFESEYWEYIGNYAKSNQFKTIYDILNS